MIREGLPFLCLLAAVSRQSRADGRVKTTVADGLGWVKRSLGLWDSLRRKLGRGLRRHCGGRAKRGQSKQLSLSQVQEQSCGGLWSWRRWLCLASAPAHHSWGLSLPPALCPQGRIFQARGEQLSPHGGQQNSLKDFIWGENLNGRHHQHGCEHKRGLFERLKWDPPPRPCSHHVTTRTSDPSPRAHTQRARGRDHSPCTHHVTTKRQSVKREMDQSGLFVKQIQKKKSHHNFGT